MRRLLRVLGALAGAAIAGTVLAGCGAADTDGTTEALAAADGDIVESSASSTMDGFTRVLGVHVELQRSEVTAAELERMLAAVVDGAASGVDRINLSVRDAAVSERTEGYIDLGDAARELGIEPVREYTGVSVALEWDDVVASVAP